MIKFNILILSIISLFNADIFCTEKKTAPTPPVVQKQRVTLKPAVQQPRAARPILKPAVQQQRKIAQLVVAKQAAQQPKAVQSVAQKAAPQIVAPSSTPGYIVCYRCYANHGISTSCSCKEPQSDFEAAHSADKYFK